jgi:hypothetical protein
MRITVELPAEDYRVLKVAAAAGGRGVSMSSVIHDLVHNYVEHLQDDIDIALVLDRIKDTRPRLTMADAQDRLTAKRSRTP